MASVIAAVQKPAFDKVGAFDLETFYPAKERLQLAYRGDLVRHEQTGIERDHLAAPVGV